MLKSAICEKALLPKEKKIHLILEETLSRTTAIFISKPNPPYGRLRLVQENMSWE